MLGKMRYPIKAVSFVLLALGLLALLAALTVNRLALAGVTEGAELRLVPTGQARAGELIRVQLVAERAYDLAGFEATVRAVDGLDLLGAILEKEITRTGRDMLQLGPVLREDEESVVLGAVTCPVADCAGSWSSPRVDQGVQGRVVLATIEIYAEQAGSYRLALDQIQLVDPQGNILPSRSAGDLLLRVAD